MVINVSIIKISYYIYILDEDREVIKSFIETYPQDSAGLIKLFVEMMSSMKEMKSPLDPTALLVTICYFHKSHKIIYFSFHNN